MQRTQACKGEPKLCPWPLLGPQGLEKVNPGVVGFCQLFLEKVIRNPKIILIKVITVTTLNAKPVATIKIKAAYNICASYPLWDCIFIEGLSQVLSHTATSSDLLSNGWGRNNLLWQGWEQDPDCKWRRAEIVILITEVSHFWVFGEAGKVPGRDREKSASQKSLRCSTNPFYGSQFWYQSQNSCHRGLIWPMFSSIGCCFSYISHQHLLHSLLSRFQ